MYRIVLLIICFLSACDSGTGLIELSRAFNSSPIAGKSYCLSQDMDVLQLQGEMRYPKLEKYFLQDRQVNYGISKYYSVVLIPKGTRITFKEMWMLDDPSNEDMHGWIRILGEISDGRKREFLVDISRLIGGHYVGVETSPSVDEQLIEACNHEK